MTLALQIIDQFALNFMSILNPMIPKSLISK